MIEVCWFMTNIMEWDFKAFQVDSRLALPLDSVSQMSGHFGKVIHVYIHMYLGSSDTAELFL